MSDLDTQLSNEEYPQPYNYYALQQPSQYQQHHHHHHHNDGGEKPLTKKEEDALAKSSTYGAETLARSGTRSELESIRSDEDHHDYYQRASTTQHHPRQDSGSSILSEPIDHIYTTGTNNEYIHIGRQKFRKNDLFEAFGGTLNPGLAPPSTHRFANPAPLGLSAFALTTFILSLYNARARGITIPNVVVGPAMFYGGLVQLVAGVWEIAVENTFGGTALCSYGGFWLSFGAIYIPWFGIIDAYGSNQEELDNAIGIYLLAWSIFTYGLSLCTMKSTVMFFALFFLLGTTFLLLSIGNLIGGNLGVLRAGGVLGVVVSFIAWYNAFAGLTNKQNSYIVIHPLPLPTNEKHL